MINKTLPYYGVIMKKQDTDVYPRYELQEGFYFSAYKKGLEEDWCKIQVKAGMVENFFLAKKAFKEKFMIYPELLSSNCVFVMDPYHRAVAVAALWPGYHFGNKHWRVHWLAVDPDYQGIGLGKALMTKLMDIFQSSDHGKWIYLTSQSWNYSAINLYYKFGFYPYLGEKPVNWYSDDFALSNKKGWQLIDWYIDSYYDKQADVICIGNMRFRLEVSQKNVLGKLKKIFPIIGESEDAFEGKIRFVESEEQKIICQNQEISFFLNSNNLYDEKVLYTMGWFCYHAVIAKKGCLLIPNVNCSI